MHKKSKILIGLIIAILIFIIIYFWIKKSKNNDIEKLSDLDAENPQFVEGKQENITIKPKIIDAGSGTIMSGTDFDPSQYMSPWYDAYTGNSKNYYLLDDGEGGAAGLQYNMCSKSCCSDQYPLPFDMPKDKEIIENKSEFVPSNYMCNNAWQNSGCVCLTKHQANFISSRGGNA